MSIINPQPLQPKTKTLWVRVTPKIDAYVRAFSHYHGIEVAETIRLSVLEYMLAHPLPEPAERVVEQDRELVDQPEVTQ